MRRSRRRKDLEEEAILHAPTMLEVVVLTEGEVETLHAQWERLCRILIEVGEVDLHLLEPISQIISS